MPQSSQTPAVIESNELTRTDIVLGVDQGLSDRLAARSHIAADSDSVNAPSVGSKTTRHIDLSLLLKVHDDGVGNRLNRVHKEVLRVGELGLPTLLALARRELDIFRQLDPHIFKT